MNDLNSPQQIGFNKSYLSKIKNKKIIQKSIDFDKTSKQSKKITFNNLSSHSNKLAIQTSFE